MRFAIATVVLLLSLLSCAVGQQSSTLADVLEQNSIATAASSIPNLDQPITSYATLNDDQEFLIAYYLMTPDNLLQFPLFLTRFDKRTGEWENASLVDVKVPVFQSTQQTECIGSVLRIERSREWYYLNLHWTPSAGCLLILNHDLTVSHTVSGWTAGFFKSGLVVYMGGTIHFSDIHPETLWVYDPVSRESYQLYPQKDDPFRKDFSSRLAKVVDLNKCRKNNWACQADKFTSDISDIEINDGNNSVAFVTTLRTEGFLTREEAEQSGNWYDDQYVYIFQLKPLRWREFSIYDLKPKFGTDSLKDLLTSGNLKRVFATSRRHD